VLDDRPDGALRWNDKALAAVKTTNPKQAAAVLESRGDLLLRAGRVAAAEEAFKQALAIAEEQHDLPRQASVRAYLGGLLMLCGRYDEAAKALEAAVDLHQKGGKPDAEALTWAALSEVYILLGADDSAA